MASAMVKCAVLGSPGILRASKVCGGRQVSGKTELCVALAAMRDPKVALGLLNESGGVAHFGPAKVGLTVDFTTVGVHLFDTSGDEGSDAALRNALEGAAVVIICFEVDDNPKDAIKDIATWDAVAKQYAKHGMKGMKTPRMLVGLRTENRYDPQVFETKDPPLVYTQGLSIATKSKMPYYDCSVAESPIADTTRVFEAAVRLALRYAKPKDLMKVCAKEESRYMQDHTARIAAVKKGHKADVKLQRKESKTVERRDSKSIHRSSSAPVEEPTPGVSSRQLHKSSSVVPSTVTSPGASSRQLHASGSSGMPIAIATPAPAPDGGAPLPPYWEMRLDNSGRWYFIDHAKKSSTYTDPRSKVVAAADGGAPLPAGWEMRKDNAQRWYFIDHNAKTSTYNDPRHAVRAEPARSASYASVPDRTHSLPATPATPMYASLHALESGSSSSYIGLQTMVIDPFANSKAASQEVTELAYPDYADPETRFLSFQNTTKGRWPHKQPSAEQCVAAGLFFQPDNTFPDRTRCYICGIQIQKWTPKDDPLVEHKKFKPNCPFVEISIKLGDRTTKSVPSRDTSQSQPRSAKASSLASPSSSSGSKKASSSSRDRDDQEDEIRKLKAKMAQQEQEAQKALQHERERNARKEEQRLDELRVQSLQMDKQREHAQRVTESEMASIEAWKEKEKSERRRIKKERDLLQAETARLQEQLRRATEDAERAAAESRRLAERESQLMSARDSDQSKILQAEQAVRLAQREADMREKAQRDLERQLSASLQAEASLPSGGSSGSVSPAISGYSHMPKNGAVSGSHHSRSNSESSSPVGYSSVPKGAAKYSGVPSSSSGASTAGSVSPSGYSSMPKSAAKYAGAPSSGSSSKGKYSAAPSNSASASSSGSATPVGRSGLAKSGPLQKSAPSEPIEEWSVSQVCDWVLSLDFGADSAVNEPYSAAFQEHHISGQGLAGLTSTDLKDELGITLLGHRKIILAEVAKHKSGRSKSSDSKHANVSKRAVAELEIDWSEVKLGKAIGEGASGIVHKASYRGQSVAVKLLKMQHFDTGVMKELLLEATIMQQLQRENCVNIVHMFGMCLKPPNIAIVTEFYELGSLCDSFDKIINGWSDVFWIALGVGRGGECMHSHDLVHRDLAARNILLARDSDGLVVPKISDFGMSRYAVSNLQQTKTNHFALKWSSPESLTSFEYGKASDIWSFGILVMECVHRGDPYPGIPDEVVAIRVRDEGFYPQLTADTPDWFADLLEKCWARNPADRPSFKAVVGAIEDQSGVVSEERGLF